MKKRILVLSHSFPPQKIPRSAQLFKLFRHFGESDAFEFDVITVHPTFSAEEMDPDLQLKAKNIRIHYAFALEFNQYFNFLLRKFGDYLPDGKLLWRFFAYQKAKKLLLKNNYDLMIGFSQYFSSVVVGARLKKRFPHIPYVSYFSDPWTFGPYFPKLSPWKLKKNRACEREVMEYSDVVILPTAEIRNRYIQMYGDEFVKKSRVIAHAYDPHLYPKPSKPKSRSKKITVVHAGNFYGARSPENFLTALKLMEKAGTIDRDRFSFDFYGIVTNEILAQLKAKKIDHFVHWKGWIDYNQSLKKISEADLLLVIEAPLKKEESFFLPSKLVDYFGAGKPILALTPLKGCVTRTLSELRKKGYPYFAADISDVQSITAQLNASFKALERPSTPSLIPPPEFSLGSIAKTWESLFLSL